jgi:hypothetical protein
MVVPPTPRIKLLTGSRHENRPISADGRVGSVYPFSSLVAVPLVQGKLLPNSSQRFRRPARQSERPMFWLGVAP